MIVVIIAGGSGTRLWPLSTPDYPKHLLQLNGSDISLLQQTYERAKKLTDKIFVVSDASHIDHVKKQLSELPAFAFIVEPARRGTASCVIAALDYIGSRYDSNETVASIHADHYIRDIAGFVHSFKIADEIASQQQRIVLVGIEPDQPATGFGYIEKGDVFSEEPFVFNVSSFKEKPDYKTALEYLRSGNYLWNAGYFVGTINSFFKAMKANSPAMYESYTKLHKSSKAEYEKTYLKFENISIDYALIEKTPDLLVVPASFDWMDLGSFSDLAKAVGADETGNHVHGEKVELEEVNNSFIQNHEAKPMAVIGLDNCVVINTPDGILVVRKDLAQKVGDVSKRFNQA